MKRQPNEETFKDGSRTLRFVADYGFLVSVSSIGRDAARIYIDLSEGTIDPECVRDILVCSVADFEDDEKSSLIEDLITRYGLQECAIMAQIMLSHAMIGDVKKRNLAKGEAIQSLTNQLIPSRSKNFAKVGLLWAACCATSTLAVCLIFRILELPIV